MAFTRPELSEPSFLPVDDCAWLGNDQDLPPPIRDPRKENPEKPTWFQLASARQLGSESVSIAIVSSDRSARVFN